MLTRKQILKQSIIKSRRCSNLECSFNDNLSEAEQLCPICKSYLLLNIEHNGDLFEYDLFKNTKRKII